MQHEEPRGGKENGDLKSQGLQVFCTHAELSRNETGLEVLRVMENLILKIFRE